MSAEPSRGANALGDPAADTLTRKADLVADAAMAEVIEMEATVEIEEGIPEEAAVEVVYATLSREANAPAARVVDILMMKEGKEAAAAAAATSAPSDDHHPTVNRNHALHSSEENVNAVALAVFPMKCKTCVFLFSFFFFFSLYVPTMFRGLAMSTNYAIFFLSPPLPSPPTF